MDEIPLLHETQAILTEEDTIPLYLQSPARFAAALAPDRARCADWAERLSPLPVGLALACPPAQAEGEGPRARTAYYIDRCKKAFRKQLDDSAAFYYLCGAPSFAALRAAVLALGDLCGRGVVARLPVADDEGHLPDGTELVAAVGVLQRIGVFAAMLAGAPEQLAAATELLAPHARLSVGVCVGPGWTEQLGGQKLVNAELFMQESGGDAMLLRALEDGAPVRRVEREHDDLMLAPDGKHAHFIAPTIDISDEIECSSRLSEALIDAEEESGALKLLLETEDDVVALEECQYLLTRPVCLCAQSAELLEQGLRVYPGLALYDGTWEQEKDILHYLEKKYGLICM